MVGDSFQSRSIPSGHSQRRDCRIDSLIVYMWTSMGTLPTCMEFSEQLQKHRSRLLGFIYALVHDLDDAEDLLQQTALILWKKFEEFDQRQSFFAWARGVARLEAANFLRRRRRQRLYFNGELNLLLNEAQAKMIQSEIEARRDALAVCVAQLRPEDRRLIEECYSGSSSIPEVAERYGRSSQSIYNSLRRIRRVLFVCMVRLLERESEGSGWIS
jgi:RNA polymerase sigma-70 factor, ECF subfamily